MIDKSHISIIVLAAGSSSRMGQSKQLLLIDNETLIERTIKTALACVENVVVVLGAHAKVHQAAIEKLFVQILFNENWNNGMGSSLKAGLCCLLSHQPDCEAVILVVCDQPLLTTAHLNKLISLYRQTKAPIISSVYSNSMGVPTLFDKSLFSELSKIPDNQGAKKIIEEHASRVSVVDFPEGDIDLDTPEEYSNFVKNIRP
jgi:molybdenum cofactor cytidylyltransferase